MTIITSMCKILNTYTHNACRTGHCSLLTSVLYKVACHPMVRDHVQPSGFQYYQNNYCIFHHDGEVTCLPIIMWSRGGLSNYFHRSAKP